VLTGRGSRRSISRSCGSCPPRKDSIWSANPMEGLKHGIHGYALLAGRE
jgi:hypothetical protein